MNGGNKLPTVTEYANNLQQAVEKLNISITEARTKYGKFTRYQWHELLKLKQ